MIFNSNQTGLGSKWPATPQMHSKFRKSQKFKNQLQILVRVMSPYVSYEPRKRNISQAYCVIAFQEAVKENYILGLWFCSSQRSRNRKVLVKFIMYFLSYKPRMKMLVRVTVSLLSQKQQQRNGNQGYIFFTYKEAAKDKSYVILIRLGRDLNDPQRHKCLRNSENRKKLKNKHYKVHVRL